LSNTIQPESHTFVRDRLTWLCYSLMAYYTYVLGSLGPLMVYLRPELNLNYSVAALHFSFLSLGSIIAGSSGDKIMNRLGKPTTIWLCGTCISIGVLILIFARLPQFTIFGALLCGCNGSVMGQTINALMSDRFGERRTIAILEANIGTSISCAMAPVVIGSFVKAGFGWRPALTLSIGAFILLILTLGKYLVVPPKAEHHATDKTHLPAAYWAYWGVIFVSVACEWSIVFWSSDFLEKIAHLVKADASMSVGAFLFAMLIGRVAGSRLAHVIPATRLLPVASLIAIAGFLTFWLAPQSAYNIIGLFIAGLGISNFYPLTLSQAISTVPGHASTAIARCSIGTGLACLVTPLLLGMVADHAGIFVGYGIVAVLLIVFVPLMLALATELGRRHQAAQS
jgi:fucose permease